MFIPAQGALNGSQVPPQPGGLFHGTRVTFQPTVLKPTEEWVSPFSKPKKDEIICMDVRPLPGQFGLSCGVDTTAGTKERNDDRVAATDIPELGFAAGVFDGHIGDICAEYVAKQLPSNVAQAYRVRAKRDLVVKLTGAQETAMISGALVDAFEAVDKAFLVTARKKEWVDGSTGIIGLVCHGFESPALSPQPGSMRTSGAEDRPGTVPRAPGGVAKLFVAWCGDARAVLIRGRQGVRCTEDHRPERKDEKERIQRAGGIVVKDSYGIWRVGREESKLARELEKRKKRDLTNRWFLSTSRSFGDLALKVPEPIVTASPEVKVIDLVPEDWAVVLASDGVFDVLSDQQVADILRNAVMEGKDPVGSAKAIVQSALRAGSRDNLTAVVMRLGWAPVPTAEGPPVAVRGAAEAPPPDEMNMFG